jgi:hypothetical protein
MKIKDFGEKYQAKVTGPQQKSWSLKKKIQLDPEPVVEGRCGMLCDLLPNERQHFTDEGKDRLGLMLTAVPRNAGMDKKLRIRARGAAAAGMELKCRAGAETAWYFDPTVPNQARTAIKLVGARKQRVLTEVQKEAARERWAARGARLQNAIP